MPPTAREQSALRLLFLSNGHGEDAIAASLARAIHARSVLPLQIEGWPMVGVGNAYMRGGIPVRGPRNTLPSEGFGTLSLIAFVRDLRAGWLRVHWRQLRAAMALQGQCDFAVAVGDVVPLAAASLSGAPFVLVGCAKSAYYGGGSGYTWMERQLMRRALTSYPRDLRTSEALTNYGVPTTFFGNPMMDSIASATAEGEVDWRDDEIVVACLPGSRSDHEANVVEILSLLAVERQRLALHRLTHFAFALPPHFDLARLRALMADSSGTQLWRWNDNTAATELRCDQLRSTLATGAFSDILSRARVAIGLGGTANEQAVGSSVPVVTFATAGVQGASYLRMKMPYFGASAIQVERSPGALADALLRIVGDDKLHARMAAAGRERMGAPGATDAIASDIARHLAHIAQSVALHR
ncbi:MAG: lipid-A-disaccharide synthase-related protein [Gemmatimonadaceae bacterium]